MPPQLLKKLPTSSKNGVAFLSEEDKSVMAVKNRDGRDSKTTRKKPLWEDLPEGLFGSTPILWYLIHRVFYAL